MEKNVSEKEAYMAKKTFQKQTLTHRKSYTAKKIRKPFPKQTLPHSKIIYTTDDRPMKQIRHIFKQRTHIFVQR